MHLSRDPLLTIHIVGIKYQRLQRCINQTNFRVQVHLYRTLLDHPFDQDHDTPIRILTLEVDLPILIQIVHQKPLTLQESRYL